MKCTESNFSQEPNFLLLSYKEHFRVGNILLAFLLIHWQPSGKANLELRLDVVSGLMGHMAVGLWYESNNQPQRT